MRDLRKKILLESGKTMSRKARSRPESTRGSPAGSPAPSRAGSRAASRYASEDEDAASDSEYDDSIASSVLNSDDGEDNNGVTTAWTDRLQDRITELLDRKRSSAKGRESTLNAYAHLIRHHYAAEQVEGHFGELVPALLRSVRGGANHEETVAALKALTLTILSAQSETVYDQVWNSLKGACENSDEESVKVEAIDAMSIAVMCGGGSVEAAEDLMDFLVEIVESDGHSVDAPDNGPVVAAALTAWGFVASHLDDLQAQSEQALEAFTEQLESTDAAVQIAAGINIALIFEAAREYEEAEGEGDEENGNGASSGAWNLQYDQHRLVQRMTALARESSKAVSKKDRKQLHASFNSVLTSLERGKGPGYSTARRQASNPHTGGSRVDFNDGEFREYGYRERIRVHNISMTIDTWSLSARVEMLRSILGGGLAAHYLENPAVSDLLSAAQVQFVSAPRKGASSEDYTSSPKKSRGPKGSRSIAGL
ncbi:hypothetical protein MGN70_007426 [Eutypa lata]|uniref:Putative ifrd domain-containing protein n=1 Tax=Eutypa lata (strain UCR-EL1) TaxID=1287681 RepID=M7SP72_EUTLA|nr:putative ifrd domain-containing protein [Eutypa lata UCREL1]KAI1250373.1 hypothetical protein MGN70_007426 [Eutypa lata]